MTADEIGRANETLREKSPLEVMEWAMGKPDRAAVARLCRRVPAV